MPCSECNDRGCYYRYPGQRPVPCPHCHQGERDYNWPVTLLICLAMIVIGVAGAVANFYPIETLDWLNRLV